MILLVYRPLSVGDRSSIIVDTDVKVHEPS
jgi:hypothetical protein